MDQGNPEEHKNNEESECREEAVVWWSRAGRPICRTYWHQEFNLANHEPTTDVVLHAYLEDENIIAPVTCFILAQYGINKDLKMFGKREEEVIIKELRQIHNLDTFIPKMADKLTVEQKSQQSHH